MASEPSAEYKAHMLEMLRTWPDRYVEYDGVPIEGYRVGRDTVEFVAWLADYVAKLEAKVKRLRALLPTEEDRKLLIEAAQVGSAHLDREAGFHCTAPYRAAIRRLRGDDGE